MSVPHLLVMEFFAAVYLVGNKKAWDELFEELDGKCRKGETRRSLEEVVRELGLENVIRFIAGLSPDIAQQLHSLFVIKQQETTLRNYYQTVYLYQLQLLQESEVKSSMAQALCNAPVITVSGSHGYVKHSGADQLLDVFTVEQSHQFLAKAYDCEIKSNSVRDVTMCRKNTDPDKDFICDGYVLRCLQKFRCTMLEMGEKMMVHKTDISIDLLPLLTSAVSDNLLITVCRLLCADSEVHIHRLLQPMSAPTLREITIGLKGSEISFGVLRLLISAVSEKLSIFDFKLLCAESGQHIHRLLQPLPAPTLREIYIRSEELSEMSVDVLRLLISAASERLDIWDCRLLCVESGEHIHRLLQPMPAPTLREIRMRIKYSEMSVDVLRLLISAVREKLSISCCTLLCTEGEDHIHRQMQPIPAPAPREISMELLHSKVPMDALPLLISAVSKKLCIRGGSLLRAENGEDIHRLPQSFPTPKLREIDMGIPKNDISVDVLRLLISSVSEKLNISGCFFLCSGSGEDIYRLLQSMPAPTLREISITPRNRELPVDILPLLISAVSEKLSLSRCRLLWADSGEHIVRRLQPIPAPMPREISVELQDSSVSVDILRLLISAVGEKLYIWDCSLHYGESEEHLHRLLQPIPAPTARDIRVRIRCSQMSVDVLRLLISAASEKLSIWNCPLQRAKSSEHTHRLLQPIPAPALREISMGLQYTVMSMDVLRLLISAASEKLSIWNCKLLCAESKEDIHSLLQPIPAPTLLEISMELLRSKMSVDVLRLLISAVSEKLFLWNCRLLCADSEEHINRLLQPIPAPWLRETYYMGLQGSEMSIDVLRLLISAVSEKLYVWGCRLLCSENADHIHRLLQPIPAPTLREIYLRLQDSEMSMDVLRLLISAVSEKLYISGCRLLCAESEEHIHRLLQPIPAPTLREMYLRLQDSEMSVDVLLLLISTVCKKLSISGCRLLCAENAEHIQSLLQPIPAPTLREIYLRLQDSEMSVDVLRLLISAVREQLYISGCRLLCAESEEHIHRLLQPILAPTLSGISMELQDGELSVDLLRLLISTVCKKLSISGCRLLCAENAEHIRRLLQPISAPTPREVSVELQDSEMSVDALRLLISDVSEKLSLGACTLLCSEDKRGGPEVAHSRSLVSAPTVRVELWHYLEDQNGRRLTMKEAKQTVRDNCPSATVTAHNWVSQCKEFTPNTTTFFSSFLL